jgi:hypothetical protein
MFFAADLSGASRHEFTTNPPRFTTQNTTSCAPNFLKTLQKREFTTQKKIPRSNKSKACK